MIHASQNSHFLITEDRQRRAVEPDVDVVVAADVVFEPGGDVDAARARVDRIHRAEKAVRLQDQLPAEAVFVIHQQHADAILRQLDRRRHPRRPAADDEHGYLDRLQRTRRRRRCGRRQDGQSFQRVDDHAGRHRRHTRLHRQSVGDDETLRTLPVRAEDALRRAVVRVVPEHVDAVRKQRRRDHLAAPRGQRLALPGKFDKIVGRNRKDRMCCDAIVCHTCSSSKVT